MSDIRYNLLDDRFVIIAPERLSRPLCNNQSQVKTKMLHCPFCEGNESMTTPEIYALRDASSEANQKGWHNRVIPNLYTAVNVETKNYIKHEGIFQAHNGFGAHEILVDTPDHTLEMHQWSVDTYINWFNTLINRIIDLKDNRELLSLTIFKNSGLIAGASQEHPHTQLIALPVIPTTLFQKYQRFSEHYHHTGHVLLEDMIVQEYQDNRVITENSDFVAFCPYASEYPFEVMIMAKEGLSRLELIDKEELQSLASIVSKVFSSLKNTLGNFDFNLFVSVPPLQKNSQTKLFFDEIDTITRFYIRITPRIYQHAGFEVATQMMINPIDPNEAARRLRG